jgi:hypothetical protein
LIGLTRDKSLRRPSPGYMAWLTMDFTTYLIVFYFQPPSSWPFLRRVIFIMRLFTSGLCLALLSFCFLGLAGCGVDNEAAINEQASRAKEKIPGSRSPVAKTQREHFEITYGVQGVGTGKGTNYPGAKR